MKLILNFSTLKQGGGQNVAFNFLDCMIGDEKSDIDYYFFVAKDSSIHSLLAMNFSQDKIFSYSTNPIVRILQELLFGTYNIWKIKPSVVYSYFGSGFYITNVPQIIGSADSNLYYPRIDFWEHYKGFGKLKKILIDKYRIFSLKSAAAVIYENPALEKRGRRLFGLKNTTTILPSVDPKSYVNGSVKYEFDGDACLLLCGWQLNKGLLLLPYVAQLFKIRKKNIIFVISASINDSIECVCFMDTVTRLDVLDMFDFIGPVEKQNIPSIYSAVRLVLLLSKLESFSNNIIESWYYSVPLVVSNEEWSRSLCGKGAFYVDRDSAEDVFDGIVSLINNDVMRKEVVSFGKTMLDSYPSLKEKYRIEVNYMKTISLTKGD